MRWGLVPADLVPEPTPRDTLASTLASTPDIQLDSPPRGPASRSGKSVLGTAFSHFAQVCVSHFIIINLYTKLSSSSNHLPIYT